MSMARLQRGGLRLTLAGALLLALAVALSMPAAAGSPDRDVWVASRDLPRGALLGEGDVRVVRLAANRIPRDAVPDGESLVGLQLRRGVREGRVVRERWVEAPSKVKRGELVRIVLRHGGLHIVGRGRAVTDGAVGDRIRVVNTDSRREVMGRVARDGSIHVGL